MLTANNSKEESVRINFAFIGELLLDDCSWMPDPKCTEEAIDKDQYSTLYESDIDQVTIIPTLTLTLTLTLTQP